MLGWAVVVVYAAVTEWDGFRARPALPRWTRRAETWGVLTFVLASVFPRMNDPIRAAVLWMVSH